jgi:hypothetical protein
MNTAPPLPSIVYPWARWSEGHAFAITPEQIGFVEGLRAAAAIAAMLAGDLLLGCPDLSWSAFAAFWTCLCDPGGPARLRLRTMGGFALAGAFISVIMAIGAMAGTVAGGLALLVAVFLCGLTRTYHPAYGPTAAQAGKWPPGHRYSYPLTEWGWTRERCEAVILGEGLPLPMKSACWMCPASKSPKWIGWRKRTRTSQRWQW